MLKEGRERGQIKQYKRNTVKTSFFPMDPLVPILLPRGKHNQDFQQYPHSNILYKYIYKFPFYFLFCFTIQVVRKISALLKHTFLLPFNSIDLRECFISQYKVRAYSFKQLHIPGDIP